MSIFSKNKADAFADVTLPSAEVFSYSPQNSVAEAYGRDSADIFDDDALPTATVTGTDGKSYTYMPFGADDQLPYELIQKVAESSVLAQNKLFNVLTCYGQGMQYRDRTTQLPTADPDIRRWLMHNSMPRFMLEQATDMKYFYFAVCAVVLNAKGDRIVELHHKEACYCRFERRRDGRSEHVLYANWRQRPQKAEVLPLLDERDPLGDLEHRMGRDTASVPRTKDRVFAVVCRFPTPGHQYYPVPYWSALLRDGWYDISRLIAIGKKAKLKNKVSIPYLIEIHKDYWTGIFRDEHIVDREKQKARIDKEKEKIKSFISGIENSGKLWITGFYSTPDGKEVNMVKITRIDTTKDGGDFSQDIAEANNVMCYADNVHPNLVGANPGSAQMNNSGSDKRELFTLKQATERAYHDIMSQVHWLIICYNRWDQKVFPDVPMIQLTTLDEHQDAKEVAATQTP